MTAYRSADFRHAPFIVFFELTQACQLACRHCRASAQPLRDPGELGTAAACALFDELARFDPKPLLVLTGGDPFERPDLEDLVRHAARAGLEVALTPSATPLVKRDALERLRDAGLSRLALSLDGADAATHDDFRGTVGSFARTLEILEQARELGMPLQVNTTLTRRNLPELEAMAELLVPRGIALWSVFFLIPVGRGALEQRLDAAECELAFGRIWELSQRVPFAIKTTEAPHYRRFAAERGERGNVRLGQGGRAPLGLNDGRGTLFVSHRGELCPSGFLPTVCGTFPADSVLEVYRNHPLFLALRDPDSLGGKCGTCEYRHICGGSRARACALTGDPLAEEPDCGYVPAGRLVRGRAAALVSGETCS